MNELRNFSPLDRILSVANDALTTIAGRPSGTGRANPACEVEDKNLDAEQTKHAAGLMRVNHAGEISAQALYQGQALTARDDVIRKEMLTAAQEENDHLLWCETRLDELGSRTSYFNPFWYLGSFAIGAIAGAAGDKWSLGFVVETERQVVRHLEEHLEKLPPEDGKSRAIVAQMKTDEAKHATTALEAGARELPMPLKQLMKVTSKIMTMTAYKI